MQSAKTASAKSKGRSVKVGNSKNKNKFESKDTLAILSAKALADLWFQMKTQSGNKLFDLIWIMPYLESHLWDTSSEIMRASMINKIRSPCQSPWSIRFYFRRSPWSKPRTKSPLRIDLRYQLLASAEKSLAFHGHLASTIYPTISPHPHQQYRHSWPRNSSSPRKNPTGFLSTGQGIFRISLAKISSNSLLTNSAFLAQPL